MSGSGIWWQQCSWAIFIYVRLREASMDKVPQWLHISHHWISIGNTIHLQSEGGPTPTMVPSSVNFQHTFDCKLIPTWLMFLDTTAEQWRWNSTKRDLRFLWVFWIDPQKSANGRWQIDTNFRNDLLRKLVTAVSCSHDRSAALIYSEYQYLCSARFRQVHGVQLKSSDRQIYH